MVHLLLPLRLLQTHTLVLENLSPGPTDPKTPGVGHLDDPHGAPFWLTFTTHHKLPRTSRNPPKDTCHRFKSRTVGIGPASHFKKKTGSVTEQWHDGKKNTSKLRNNMRCKMYQNVHQLEVETTIMLLGHPMILVKSTHKVTSHSPGWLGRPLKAKPKEAKHQQRATVSPKPSRPWLFATSPSIASDAETTRKKSSWDSLSMERFGLPRWWMKSPPFPRGDKALGNSPWQHQK